MSASGDIGTQAIKDGAVTNAEIATGTIAATKLATNSVDKTQLALGILQYTDTTLSTAQILLLNTTPISLVAAPGSGLVLLPVALYATLTYVAAAYSANAAGFTVRYTNGSGQTTAMTLTQGFIQSSANAIFHVVAGATAIIPVANAALVAYADSANPTTGDSAIKIRVFYRVLANPVF